MSILVFQSDFGLDDAAVSTMYGVALGIDKNLKIYDITHGIEPYNIMEASYRLIQTINYWPKGTIFVSVVDPGVGSDRKSVVVKTNDDKYIVTPDNGTITLVKKLIGIKEVRIINEATNRRPDSYESYTFNGRDIYAYTGAKLAADIITFEEVGDAMEVEKLVTLNISQPIISENVITGSIVVLDIRFGSLWTNIDKKTFEQLDVNFGEDVEVAIANDTRTVYRNKMTYGRSFADVHVGEAVLYINSLNCVGIAINQGSFAKAYNVGTGNNWVIKISKV